MVGLKGLSGIASPRSLIPRPYVVAWLIFGQGSYLLCVCGGGCFPLVWLMLINAKNDGIEQYLGIAIFIQKFESCPFVSVFTINLYIGDINSRGET